MIDQLGDRFFYLDTCSEKTRQPVALIYVYNFNLAKH